jgi:hypothetical protein
VSQYCIPISEGLYRKAREYLGVGGDPLSDGVTKADYTRIGMLALTIEAWIRLSGSSPTYLEKTIQDKFSHINKNDWRKIWVWLAVNGVRREFDKNWSVSRDERAATVPMAVTQERLSATSLTVLIELHRFAEGGSNNPNKALSQDVFFDRSAVATLSKSLRLNPQRVRAAMRWLQAHKYLKWEHRRKVHLSPQDANERVLQGRTASEAINGTEQPHQMSFWDSESSRPPNTRSKVRGRRPTNEGVHRARGSSTDEACDGAAQAARPRVFMSTKNSQNGEVSSISKAGKVVDSSSIRDAIASNLQLDWFVSAKDNWAVKFNDQLVTIVKDKWKPGQFRPLFTPARKKVPSFTSVEAAKAYVSDHMVATSG